MRRTLFCLLLSLVAVVALQAQALTCRIDGPANVRQQPTTKSRVMGSIKNGCVAKVSKVNDSFWYIHEVYNPKGGAAYTGKAVGYYTHRQNVILTGGQSGAGQSRRQSGVSGMPWIQGHWQYVSAYGPVDIYISGGNMTVYFGSERGYCGKFGYDDGLSYGDGWERLTYPGGFVLMDSRRRQLYFDVDVPMRKVR